MKIGYLPLDSRPCNARFPCDLASGSDVELVLPTPSALSTRDTMPRFESIRDFLSSGSDWDAAIVSLDALCYGGLVAARGFGELTRLSFCLERLAWLDELKAVNPGVRIILFGVAARSGVAVLKKEDLAHWEKLQMYSRLAWRSACGDTWAACEAERLEHELPSEVFGSWKQARERNAHVLREALERVAVGTVDDFTVYQEDCEPEGLHRFDRELLLERIGQLGIDERARITNGIDEAGCVALARAINELHGAAPAVWTEWIGNAPGDEERILFYEDRPVRENVRAHLVAVGCCEARSLSEADFVLACVLSQGAQCDLALGGRDDTPMRYAQTCISRLANCSERVSTYCADLICVNGGSITLLSAVRDAGLLEGSKKSLSGYAAWNTASNSIGTAIAQGVVSHVLENREAQRRFFLERLLDDGIYQGNVREALMRGASGVDAWKLPDGFEESIGLSALLEKNLRAFDASLAEECATQGKIHAAFPWRRLFEIDVSLDA